MSAEPILFARLVDQIGISPTQIAPEGGLKEDVNPPTVTYLLTGHDPQRYLDGSLALVIDEYQLTVTSLLYKDLADLVEGVETAVDQYDAAPWSFFVINQYTTEDEFKAILIVQAINSGS